MLNQRDLDALWDFDSPASSELRITQAAEASDSADERAELHTQRARALGLQGRFSDAEGVLDDVVTEQGNAPAPAVAVRVALERGRILNSSGRQSEAIPYFRDAAALASAARLSFLEVDALHMLAIADEPQIDHWTMEGLSRIGAESDDATKRWGVALHNNLGWHVHDQERYPEALVQFELALASAQQWGSTRQRFAARWAVARCLRSLGQHDAALEIQQQLAVEQPDDAFVREELELLAEELSEF